MVYFREKNGNYYAKNLSGGASRSPVLRIIFSLFPVIILGGIYLTAVRKDGKPEEMLPIVIGISIFLFTSVLSLFLRKIGFGAGITVDQMHGTVSCKLPGGQKHVIPIASVKEIGLQYAGSINPDTTSYTGTGKVRGFLFLLTRDEKKFTVMYGNNAIEMRQFADELSILISATVNEYNKGPFQ